MSLSISIVVYQLDSAVLARTLATLHSACQSLQEPVWLYLVDNGNQTAALQQLGQESGFVFELIAGHGNIGYGRGHNLALDRTSADFHLILNPDVFLEESALQQGLLFLCDHPHAGLITPHVLDEQGQRQYLCKRYPSLWILFLRGFAPTWFKHYWQMALDRYEMRDVMDSRQIFRNPLLVTGCFMLYRTCVLKRLGGFDPRFFVHFEDMDLSLRTSALADIYYLPQVRITHLGGYSARKGLKHIGLFIQNAGRFFHKHGWKIF